VLGISALCPVNAANPRPFEPESEPETPGIGAFCTAEWEKSLSANGRFGTGWRYGSGEPERALLGTPLGRKFDIPNEPVRGQLSRLTTGRQKTPMLISKRNLAGFAERVLSQTIDGDRSNPRAQCEQCAMGQRLKTLSPHNTRGRVCPAQ
jgi:hypothetical protein